MDFDKRKRGDAAKSSSQSLPREAPLCCSETASPKAFANVFIAIVGVGVLDLPYTFMRTGWLTSLLAGFLVALLTFHCMMLFIHTRRRFKN